MILGIKIGVVAALVALGGTGAIATPAQAASHEESSALAQVVASSTVLEVNRVSVGDVSGDAHAFTDSRPQAKEVSTRALPVLVVKCLVGLGLKGPEIARIIWSGSPGAVGAGLARAIVACLALK